MFYFKCCLKSTNIFKLYPDHLRARESTSVTSAVGNNNIKIID